jgi:hypothetical protein
MKTTLQIVSWHYIQMFILPLRTSNPLFKSQNINSAIQSVCNTVY